MFFSTLLTSATFANLAIAGYVLEDDYMQDFYSKFDFFTGTDPTDGFVKYVDQSTAQSTGLINSTSTSNVRWGVDTTNQTPNGRPSIRIASTKTYDSGLIVLDVAHMPAGCGTWPAFWMLGPDWPSNGEIDILEGVNDQASNQMTLHTGPGCSITNSTSTSGGGASTNAASFTGNVITSNCDINAANQDKNAGCSIGANNEKSYGAGLNSNNGGVFATEWTDSAISIYFFPRGSIPSDVLGDSPNPSGWGTPAARFQGACNIPSTFKNQQIVFDTTFCGQWAGQVWGNGTCASKADTCNAFVQNNPSAFTEAYWSINALKVYQDGGNSTPAASSVVGGASSYAAPTTVVVSSALSSVAVGASTAVPPAQTTYATVPVGHPSHSGGPHRGATYTRPSSQAQVSGAAGSQAATVSSDAVAAPAVSSTAAAAVNNGVMESAFNWPQAQGGQATGAASSAAIPSAATSVGAAPSSASGPAFSLSTTATPTLQTTVVAAVPAPATTSGPAIPIVNSAGDVMETVYDTIYVTVAPSAAAKPRARRANHLRAHVRARRHGH